MEQSKKVKVRFAPSPTGIPHIGNTRTALFNFLFAKHNKGDFILRIEDTDQKRIVKGAEEAIFNILNWLGLDFNGEVIRQSTRLNLYKEYVQILLDKKLAHIKDGATWVNIPDDKILKWKDLVGEKQISFLGKDQEDFVILKSDGYPTYHLANVIDDYLMGITHVIRGEEWISSTPKHLYLYESFGWNKPFFAHLPVILGTDKSKLSKRHGAKSALDYKEDGYLKETVLNYMALLGWRSAEEKEQMSLDQMIKLFDLKDINTSNPIFDIDKMDWLNGVWIRSISDLDKRLLEFYKSDKEVEKILKGTKSKIFISAASSRMRNLADFKNLISAKKDRKKTIEESEISIKLLEFLNESMNHKKWENENFLAALKKFSKEKNIPFKIIYFLLTGKEKGIGLLELNEIYGKEFFIKNLSE